MEKPWGEFSKSISLCQWGCILHLDAGSSIFTKMMSVKCMETVCRGGELLPFTLVSSDSLSTCQVRRLLSPRKWFTCVLLGSPHLASTNVSWHCCVPGSLGSFRKVPNTLRNCTWKWIPKTVVMIFPSWCQPAVNIWKGHWIPTQRYALKTCELNSHLDSLAFSKF